MSRGALLRLVFAGLTTAGVLALLEAGARLAERPAAAQTLPTPEPRTMTTELAANLKERQAAEPIRVELVPDAKLGWMPAPRELVGTGEAPGSSHVLGLRSPDPAPRVEGEERLFSLGDSSIWGTGVNLPQTFTAVAATALGRAWQRPVSGIVGGVPGYDSSHSRVLLETVGEQVDPTLLVVANMWSDLGRRQLLDEATPSPVADWLGHSALFRLSARALSPALRERKVRFLAGRADIGEGDDLRHSQAEYVADLRAMAAWAVARDARVAFVMLPAPIDWDGAPPPPTLSSFRDCMRMVAAEYDSPLVDGPAYFHDHGADTSYFLDQVHPDDRGHYLLGMALAEALLDADR